MSDGDCMNCGWTAATHLIGHCPGGDDGERYMSTPARPSHSWWGGNHGPAVLFLMTYVGFAVILGQWDAHAPAGYRYAIAAVLISGLAWEALRSGWIRR